MSLDHTFCPIPWNHISTYPNGAARICCDMINESEGNLHDRDGRALNLKEVSIAALRNHPNLMKIRKEMTQGQRPSVCRQCWKREDLDLSSRRKDLLRAFPDLQSKAVKLTGVNGEIQPQNFPIQYMDLRLGNNCNLMCRSCGPHDSSLWQEYKMRNRPSSEVRLHSESEWNEDSVLLRELKSDSQGLKMLYFTGGEPFINRHHWNILRGLIEQGQSQKIELQYNSNVLVIPRDAFSLWQKFSRVHVTCSIDGLGQYAEYIRPPSRWQQIEKNIVMLDQSTLPLSLDLSPTISVLNIAHIPDIIIWALKNNFKRFNSLIRTHLLFYPKYLSCQILPAQSKARVIDKYETFWLKLHQIGREDIVEQLKENFQNVLNYMMEQDQSELLPRFREHTQVLDRHFGRSFARDLPFVHQLIEGK